MRAVLYHGFCEPLTVENVSDPTPALDGVVIEVKASGLCRSDWHGWMGHDKDIQQFPHVPGHELAGVVVDVGDEVLNVRMGDRVTVPFVCACGKCPQCAIGNQQVCDDQFQPGFTHWGSFAEFVAIGRADVNIVTLPDEIGFVSAASLGCRFTTSYRAVVDQAVVIPGEWVVVHGCGGVGLSAIMIASALGAQVIAVDISRPKLELARSVGAHSTIDALEHNDVVESVQQLSGGGPHVSIDALGSTITCQNSIACLRKGGKHIQIGLLTGDESRQLVAMDAVISKELQVIGSHGMQAHRYPNMLKMVQDGLVSPQELVGETISLDEVPSHLPAMSEFKSVGLTVIDRF
ncbi:MAG: zinc-dependent alcohol dehydrogenase family protein [Anaerolineales bacterium]